MHSTVYGYTAVITPTPTAAHIYIKIQIKSYPWPTALVVSGNVRRRLHSEKEEQRESAKQFNTTRGKKLESARFASGTAGETRHGGGYMSRVESRHREDWLADRLTYEEGTHGAR